jgi:hypothetical protein
MLHSPERIAWQARWVATKELEQAVWTLMLGPVKFNLYEMRVLGKSLSLPM